MAGESQTGAYRRLAQELADALAPVMPDEAFRAALRRQLERQAALVAPSPASRFRLPPAAVRAAARAGAVAALVALLVGSAAFATLAHGRLAADERGELLQQAQAAADALRVPDAALDPARMAALLGAERSRVLSVGELAASPFELESLQAGRVVSRMSAGDRAVLLVPLPDGAAKRALEIEAPARAQARAAGFTGIYALSFTASLIPSALAGWLVWRRARLSVE